MNIAVIRKKMTSCLADRLSLGSAFYYAFWTVMLYAKALNLTSADWQLQLCILAAGIFWGLKFLCTEWDLKSAVVTTVLLCLGVLTYFGSRDTGILFTILAITGAKDVNLNRLIRYIFWLKLLIFVATILMAVTGITENVYETVATNEGLVLKNRYYLGFIHPNYCHAALFILLALYSYLNFRKIGIWHLTVYVILNFILYLFTQSRTGLFLIFIFCALLVLLRRRRIFRFGKWIWTIAPVFCFGLSVVLGLRVDNSLALQDLDFDLSGRLSALNIYLTRFSPTPFGTTEVMEYMANNEVLDNFYVRLLLQYGTGAFVFFLLGTSCLIYYLCKKGRASAVLLVLSFLVLGLLEHFTQDAFLNVSLLFFIYALYGENPAEPFHKEEFGEDSSSLAIAKNSLLGSFVYYFVYTILNVVIPIVTAVYISRILGSDGVGRVNSAQNIVTYFVIVASLGIPNYGAREIAKASSREERDKVYSEIFFINLCSTLVCVAAYFIMLASLGFFRQNFPLYGMVSVQLVLNIFNVDWLYRGSEEYRYISASSLFVKIICLFAMFQFVVDRQSVETYALISSLALSAGYALNFFHADKLARFRFKDISIKRHFKPVLALLATQLAVELYILLDTTMLTFLRTESEVGYYTNAIRLVKTVVSLLTTIGAFLLPRLSYYYERKQMEDFHTVFNRAFRVLILLSVPCMLGLYLLSDTVVLTLYGAEFFPSIQIMMILCPLLVIMSIGNLFGTQLLMVVGHERRLLYSVLIGAGSNILMNAFLIPLFGGPGAAIASVLSELFVMIAQILLSRGYYRVSVPFGELLKTIFSSLVMLAAVSLIKIFVSNRVVELILGIVGGGAVFFLFELLLKNELLLELLSAVKAKLSARFGKRRKA